MFARVRGFCDCRQMRGGCGHSQEPRLLVLLLGRFEELDRPALDVVRGILVNGSDRAVHVPHAVVVMIPAGTKRCPFVEVRRSPIDGPPVEELTEDGSSVTGSMQVALHRCPVVELGSGAVVANQMIVRIAAGED